MRQERIFFTVLFITITVLAVIVMQPFLTYVVLAAILTYTLYPVYRFIQKRLGRPELSSAISLIIFVIAARPGSPLTPGRRLATGC